MVCSGAAKMEMGTTSAGAGGGGERSLKAPLHNFNLPSFLKWGHQRQLRCKLPEKDTGEGGRRKRSAPAEEEEGIDAVREKIMFDLKTAAERMKVAMFRDGLSDEDESDDEVAPEKGKVASAPAAEEEGKRWNLRTRKGRNGLAAAAPAPTPVGSASAGGYSSSSPMRGVEKKRAKFSVALSRKEIEEDFMAMVGHRPARRPKKRPRTVQRHLDTIFPGLWLSEVTADTYKVPEVPDAGKR